MRIFQILNSWKLLPYVGIKKCRDKEMSEYNIKPSRATNYTHTHTHTHIYIKIERLNIKIPSLTTV